MNKPAWIPIAKWLVFLLVVGGIVYTIWSGVTEFQNSRFSLLDFHWRWLPLAIGCYFVSMCITWVYWHKVMQGLGQLPEWRHSFRAFLLGQLGKYFPGKALVVVIRTSSIRGPRVQTAVAATSVFIETLTYMAVGAAVAAVLLILFVKVNAWIMWISIGAIFAAGLPIMPPVFRALVKICRIDRLSPKIAEAAKNLSAGTALLGWILLPLSWMLVGLSLWSIIQMTGIGSVSFSDFPRVTSCAALAIVVGFLSMMPGGLGVRELVLVALLNPIDPVFDSASTLLIAVTLRLCWLMTELIATTILKITRFGSNSLNNDDPPNSPPPDKE